MTICGGSFYAYHYGKNGRIEEVVNARGCTTIKNTYDEKRRVTRQDFPDGSCMEYVYDDKKRQVVLTERNGSRTTYGHDSKYRNTDILYGGAGLSKGDASSYIAKLIGKDLNFMSGIAAYMFADQLSKLRIYGKDGEGKN